MARSIVSMMALAGTLGLGACGGESEFSAEGEAPGGLDAGANTVGAGTPLPEAGSASIPVPAIGDSTVDTTAVGATGTLLR